MAIEIVSLQFSHQKMVIFQFASCNWLVVEPPLWKIWKSNGMIIPNIWKITNLPNHQPDQCSVGKQFIVYGWSLQCGPASYCRLALPINHCNVPRPVMSFGWKSLFNTIVISYRYPKPYWLKIYVHQLSYLQGPTLYGSSVYPYFSPVSMLQSPYLTMFGYVQLCSMMFQDVQL